MKKIGVAFLCFLQFACMGQRMERINGVSFVGSREKVTQTHIDPVLEVNANYAAIMPFGFTRSLSSPEVVFNTERQWFGETRKGAKQYIESLQKNGVKIMIKPQIWIWRGEFTGDLKMESEADWKTLEKSYTDFILTYAGLAQECNVEIFCIGTELDEFIVNRPEFWFELIGKIKSVYTGKLTYAANWDEYGRTPFWKELDYIGVDAYFPLSEVQNPSVVQLKAGWQPWKAKLKTIAENNEKPILFTEYGYRSMDFTGHKPWLVDYDDMQVNLQAQADATQVILETFWNEDWFAGGFIWKWFINHEKSGGTKDDRFTPQNKPAEKVLRQFYAQK